VFLGYNSVAQSLYNTLILIEPHNFLFLYKYAVFCAKIKQFDKAEENFLSSLEQNPNYLPTLVAYAKFLSEHLHDNLTAERFFKRALEVCPTNCYVLFNYGVFLRMYRKSLEEAKDYFKRALDLPTFESLDEILLLKDYSSILQDQLDDNPTSQSYQDRFNSIKNEWEKKNQSEVQYPNYKTAIVHRPHNADYGYVM